MAKNVFYAQSGGVTAVINATACGVIEAARKTRKIGKVFAGKNGIIGALREELIDTSRETNKAIASLRHTPSGAFGSCRYKLKSFEENKAEYLRIIDVFMAHNIGYFFYNGGGDSQDTAYKVSQLSARMGHPVTCIGIPKTVDNDLPLTDTCPGFGSVAKYVAVSTMEAGLDVASMAESSTKVFVLEVMGRHAGWIAAAAGLAKKPPRHGSLCFHPSLLPAFRGGAALAWQIILGASESGVSVFKVEGGVDEGPIVIQQGGVPISDSDTTASLYFDKLYAIGVEAMVEAVARVAAGTATFTPQRAEGASFQGLVTDEVARIDWSNPALEVDRLIRGCTPGPGRCERLDR